MNDAQFVLGTLIVFVALLYLGEWLLDRLYAWWEGRVSLCQNLLTICQKKDRNYG